MCNFLKIATWNLDKPLPNGWSKNPIILKLQEIEADIWILTETNDVIDLANIYNKVASYSPPEWNGFSCTTIWSRFPIKQLQTYNSWESVCVEIESPIGNFLVYGTIITWAHDGVLEGKAKVWERHYESIKMHGKDWVKLSQNLPFCVAGDFNEALSPPFDYGTRKGREMLNTALEQSNLVCVTAYDKIGYNIDHICLSVEWSNRVSNVNKWQAYKSNGKPVSDHYGISVELCFDQV